MEVATYTLFSADGTQIDESLSLDYLKEVVKHQNCGRYYIYEWWGEPGGEFREHCPQMHYEFVCTRNIIGTHFAISNKKSLFKGHKI